LISDLKLIRDKINSTLNIEPTEIVNNYSIQRALLKKVEEENPKKI
jgi:sensor histidine kinase regulating citrate/malate metabolism